MALHTLSGDGAEVHGCAGHARLPTASVRQVPCALVVARAVTSFLVKHILLQARALQLPLACLCAPLWARATAASGAAADFPTPGKPSFAHVTTSRLSEL